MLRNPGHLIVTNPRRVRAVVCLATGIAVFLTGSITVSANVSQPSGLAPGAAAAPGELPVPGDRYTDTTMPGSSGVQGAVPADMPGGWLRAGEPGASTSGEERHAGSRHRDSDPKLLVVGQTPLSESAVRAVKQDNRVDRVLTFDGALVQVGNVRTNVLGVDPARFREWAPKQTAGNSRLWPALERGGLLLAPEISPKDELRDGQAYEVTGEVSRTLRVAGVSDIGLRGIGGLVSQRVGAELGLRRNTGVIVDASNEDLPGLIRSLSTKLGSHARVISLRPLPAPRRQAPAPSPSMTSAIRTDWPAERATISDPTSGGVLTPRMYELARTLDAAGAAGGGMSCWDEHEWAPFSDHPKGKACDVFFDPYDKASVEYGWQVVSWLIQTQATYGMKYVIWQGWYWSAEERVWEPYVSDTYGCPDRRNVTGCHYDHIHISVY